MMARPHFVDANMFSMWRERSEREMSRGAVSQAVRVSVGRLREFEIMTLDPTKDEYNRLAGYFGWRLWK